MVKTGTPCFFEVAYLDGDLLWFVSTLGKGLFLYDLNECKLSFISTLDDSEDEIWRLVGAIVKVDDSLVMAPFNGDDFYIYNIKTSCLKKIKCEIKEERKAGENNARFWCGIADGRFVYFIGCYYSGVAKVDPINEIVQYINVDVEDVHDEGAFFRNTALKLKSSLVIPGYQCGIIVLVDLDNNVYKRVEIKRSNGFMGFCLYKNKIIGIGKDYKIYLIDYNVDTEVWDFEIIDERNKRMCTHNYIRDNLLYTFDQTKGDAEIINLDNKTSRLIKCEGIDGDIGKNMFEREYFSWIEKFRDGFLAFYPRHMELCELDRDLRIRKKHKFKLSDEDYNRYYNTDKSFYAVENDCFNTLEIFLKDVVRKKENENTVKEYRKWKLEDFLTV